jgi:hypothetical protein
MAKHRRSVATRLDEVFARQLMRRRRGELTGGGGCERDCERRVIPLPHGTTKRTPYEGQRIGEHGSNRVPKVSSFRGRYAFESAMFLEHGVEL